MCKDARKAYEQTCLYISTLVNNIPTHVTGAAIDIKLFDIKTNKIINMSSNSSGGTTGSDAHTLSTNITQIYNIKIVLC